MFSVPLMVLLPSLAASVGTKSGSKRIFDAADVNAFPLIYDLFDPSLLQSAIVHLVLRSPQSRRVEMKFEDEVTMREAEDIVGKEFEETGLRTEDEALLLEVLEELEEAKEGEGEEMKGGCPAAHRELVERIKKSQGE
ncbi:uncharacterized protein MONOS_14312 [Monocercomonoides exilis]|uniref:uncharacterized protein n=1 Tax=Monocercomonoides exilis TaxID=2049356 RepID=UPI003559DB6B|nr:hypothetical protein MONOS_14312 [Monocercomonoides exilis]|eukprot:MONOS_14312.1-p1 / transcript=MONOS_14312.1 / gene=MONOS_14312 / organism=Monocercomonoides_exilis_PA203 / gene_product=unspecified product / transcript_product=unspecified product / location=Mono_scaffold00977:18962-19375(+) / protein_length=138 / sequence_SO=supercontig / SO=protein_coding / is_pseudo=false